ncbi:hypothetical protein ES705_29175 [subsurface metagenome]
MKRPKYSLIVPAYNEEKYIERCLQSLISQNYPSYEIIVIDNNSTDRTAEIAKGLVDKVLFEPRKGYIHATNRGAREARGKYISFCDADSIYPPNWLEKVNRKFEKNPEIVVVYGPTFFSDYNFFINNVAGITHSLFLIYSKLRGLNVTAGYNTVMNRDSYFKVGGYDENIYNSIGIDLELGKRLRSVGKVKLNSANFVLTSSRRFKEDGIFHAIHYHIEMCNNVRKEKAQSISYEEYNREYGR